MLKIIRKETSKQTSLRYNFTKVYYKVYELPRFWVTQFVHVHYHPCNRGPGRILIGVVSRLDSTILKVNTLPTKIYNVKYGAVNGKTVITQA